MKVLPAALAAFLFAQAAAAATLTPVDLTDTKRYESSTQLFGVEIKRDQNVQNSGGSGKDAFLRNSTNPNTPASMNVAWGASGTSYGWSLGYDGDTARLAFGTQSTTLDIAPDGRWNALSVYARALDASKFASVTTTFTITRANGAALSAPLILSATNGNTSGTFALSDLGKITSLDGTLSFAFALKQGAAGSPNSRVGVQFGALDVTPAAVPLPATLSLFAPALGLLAVLRRRRRGMA